MSELLATPNVDVSNYSSEWPTASLEIEEAAKCIALGRVVAAVFHCMRCLEVGIEALSVHLEIEPPTKTSDKTWGTILGKIKSKIDEIYPANKRLNGTKGHEIEKIYTTLDAVKNPWRNATMHVDATYLPHEAIQIATCTGFFLVVSMAETNCARWRGKSVPIWLREKGNAALGSDWFVGIV